VRFSSMEKVVPSDIVKTKKMKVEHRRHLSGKGKKKKNTRKMYTSAKDGKPQTKHKKISCTMAGRVSDSRKPN